jgi:glycosyltransferase involved in cell wall biosynthesis
VTALRLSVVMCTHNGARHVRAQLDSIAGQTRLPDELVAFDDASTDETVPIVRRFAAAAPFPVRLTVNPERLGSTPNFQNAIGAADGEIMVLSDQDDVWRPQKLERIESAFAAAAGAGCMFSDAEIVDDQLRPLGYRLWDALRLDRRQRRSLASGSGLAVLLQRNVVTGATMAFRADLRPLVLPIPPGWVHDGWIALLAAAVSGCVPLDEPLVLYRQHPSQQIGGAKATFRQQVATARQMDRAFFASLAENYDAARVRLANSRTHRCPPTVIEQLEAKVRHSTRRARMRDGRRLRLHLILGELLSRRYWRYSGGWKSVAQDLFL